MFGRLGLFRKTRVKKVKKSLNKQTKKLLNKLNVFKLNKRRPSRKVLKTKRRKQRGG